ncbi:hypothetical protein PINS_up010722 [Pythium insidiosum]|nr:hypothetical protein PINS_up010722 [Pythium insidiosum]
MKTNRFCSTWLAAVALACLLLPTALLNGTRFACAALPGDPTPARLDIGWTGFDSEEATQRMTIFPRRIVPQSRVLHQPGALWIAVNFRSLALLPGDRLELQNEGASTRIQIMRLNESLARRAWEQASLWDHPFLLRGSRVVVTYWPSLRTLALPIDRPQLDNAVAVIDSVTFGTRRRRFAVRSHSDSKSTADTLESVLGPTNDMTPAVCFKNCSPAVYNSARAVARLIIPRDPEDPPQRVFLSSSSGEPTANTWTFCTGWLVGRGNHLLTNYHCFYDVLARRPDVIPTIQRAVDQPTGRCDVDVATSSSRDDERSRNGDDTRVTVNFNAEASTCDRGGRMGEPAGVIAASRVRILVANERLDYCLLRVETNDSTVDLARTYGYLRMRASGPVDSEPVYVPQHPNGAVKMITVSDEGRPSTIRLTLPGSSSSNRFDNVSVWYNADTAPGSSGSPVLSLRDHSVVALHHAGTTARSPNESDLNSGVRIDAIVADLRARRALPPCAIAERCVADETTACCLSTW